MSAVPLARLDRSALEVGLLNDDASDRRYWRSRSPQERLQALELMRQIIYGYDPASTRLQRVLAVASLV